MERVLAATAKMTVADLRYVAQVHAKAFPGFFLTRLGNGFLSAYYQAVLDYPGSIAFVVRDADNDALRGFAVGFDDPGSFYAFFSKRKRKFLPEIAFAVLRSPSLLGAIYRNFRRVENPPQTGPGTVELSSIATDGCVRGTGSLLLRDFVNHARQIGGKEVVLTTDADDNDQVRSFYEKRGFVLGGYEQRHCRRLCHYSRLLG